MDRSSKKVIRAKAFCTSETCLPITRYFYLNVRFRKLFGPLLKKTMQRGDDLRAFPHCRCDAFDRARTDIANGESPALAGFRRFAIFARSSSPFSSARMAAGSTGRCSMPIVVWPD